MKTKIEKAKGKPVTIPMSEMEPCDIGYVREAGNEFDGQLVIMPPGRGNRNAFAFDDLRIFSEGCCYQVELITEPVIVKFIPD